MFYILPKLNLNFVSPPTKENGRHETYIVKIVVVQVIPINDPLKALSRDAKYNYYTTLGRVNVEPSLENILYIFQGLLDMSYQYYDSSRTEYIKLDKTKLRDYTNSGMRLFIIPSSREAISRRFDILWRNYVPKIENFIDERPKTMTESFRINGPSLRFGYIRVLDIRGPTMMRRDITKAIEELSKPYGMGIDFPKTRGHDNRRKHKDLSKMVIELNMIAHIYAFN